MSLYEIFSGEELKIAEKIQQRRYQMLVHSYIYYEMNENIISDSKWSGWAMELVELQSKYPHIAEKVIYAKDFADWDGSSGAFLIYTDKPNIVITANRLTQGNHISFKPTQSVKPAQTSRPSLFVPQPKKPLVKTPAQTKKKLF